MAQFGLLSGSTPKKVTDPLKSINKQNAASRALLESIGEKDPTKDKGPSALERIFGIMDAPGAGVRSLVHNAVADENVNPLQEMWKSLKGEGRIEGSDILEKMGVENKWGRMLGGFAVDILLDPLTYATFGFGSAAKSGGKTLLSGIIQYGDNVDDIVKATGLADDVVRGGIEALKSKGLLFQLDDIAKGGKDAAELSQDVMTTLYKQFGEGGVKFAGIPLGGEKLMSSLGYKAKAGLRTLPGAKWTEQTFGMMGLAPQAVDTLRQGNEVTNLMLKALKGDENAGYRMAELAGKRMDEALRTIVPDETARRWAGVAYGARFGDDAQELAQLSDEFRSLMQAGDAVAAQGIYDDSMKLLAKAEAGAQANLDHILKDVAGLNPDQYDQAMLGINTLREQMQDIYTKRRPFIKMGLFGDTGEGYLPGMGKESLDDIDIDIVKKLGQDPENMRVPEHLADPNYRQRKEYLTGIDRITGIKRDAGTLPVSTVIGETYDDGRLLTKRGRVASELEEQGPGLFTETDLATLGGKAYSQQRGKLAVDILEKQVAQVTGDPNLAHAIGKASKGFFTNDESTKGFLHTFDKLQNFWKRQATIMRFPAFQERNGLTNKLLMWQDGALSLAGEEKSIGLVTRMMKKTLTESDAELLDEMVEHGVLTTFKELSEQVGQAGGNKVTKWLGEFNTVIENQSRISAYLTYRSKGLAKQAAGEMTNKALFNYSDDVLSVFEEHVIKRLVPFYKWSKNNLSKQTRLLMESPGKSVWLGHLKESGESVVDYDRSVMPDWLRDINAIPLPINDSGKPVMLSSAGLFPQSDLELLSGFTRGEFEAKDLFGMVSPLLRTPFEILVAKKDIYYGTELNGVRKRAPGYIEAFDDVVANTPLSVPWNFIKDALGIAEVTDEKTQEPYLVMDERMVKFLRDFSPWMNSIGKAMADVPRQKYDLTSFLTGIKPVLYDEEQLRTQKAYDDRAQLQEALSILKSQGVDTSTSKPKAKTLSDLLGVK